MAQGVSSLTTLCGRGGAVNVCFCQLSFHKQTSGLLLARCPVWDVLAAQGADQRLLRVCMAQTVRAGRSLTEPCEQMNCGRTKQAAASRLMICQWASLCRGSSQDHVVSTFFYSNNIICALSENRAQVSEDFAAALWLGRWDHLSLCRIINQAWKAVLCVGWRWSGDLSVFTTG